MTFWAVANICSLQTVTALMTEQRNVPVKSSSGEGITYRNTRDPGTAVSPKLLPQGRGQLMEAVSIELPAQLADWRVLPLRICLLTDNLGCLVAFWVSFIIQDCFGYPGFFCFSISS